MAVRQAGRGPSGAIYALVIFIFLFFIAGGAALMIHGQLDEARKDLAEYRATEEKNRADTNEGKEFVKAHEGDNAPIDQAVADRRAFANLLVGKPDASLQDAKAALAKHNVSAAAVAHINALNDKLKTQSNLSAMLAEKVAEIAKLTSDIENLKKTHMAALAAANSDHDSKIEALKQDHQTAINAAEVAKGVLEAEYTKSKNASDATIQKQNQAIGKLGAEMQRQKLEIATLRNLLRRESPSVPDTTNHVDATITAVHSEESLVYINLGKSDQLVPGLTFEVFSPLTGVQLTKTGNNTTLKRGKASIEVVKIVSNSTAACRIIRADPNDPIRVNDPIANLVYDKNRKIKFYIFGEFDLDGDGRATVGDRDKVVQLIQKWGGEVVQISEREKRLAALIGKEGAAKNVLPIGTDYLVVGREPAAPGKIPEVGSPAEIRAAIEAKKKWDIYNMLKREAQSLTVPVLNQTRFLYLIGHYHQ